MRSIRSKLFVQIGFLIILFVTLLFMANSILLEPYYVNKQKQLMIDAYNIVNALDGIENYSITIDELSYLSNMEYRVINKKGELIYQSSIKGMKKPPDKRPPDVVRTDIGEDNIIFKWVRGPFYEQLTLVLEGELSNGNHLNIIVPLQIMEDNINIMNQFIIIIGGIVFFISMFAAYILSNSFTKPIRSINAVTKKMQQLEFDYTCDIYSKDELGELAKNINSMSKSLSENIAALYIKDERRRTLLNNVSHELKTPLTLMQGYSIALKNNILKDTEKVDYYCDVIIDETKKMSCLVENLLNINQMKLGDEVLNKVNFDIIQMVEDLIERYEEGINDKKINVSFDYKDVEMAYGDSFLIERVITNYLTNAIQYVDKRKKIYIEVKAVEGVIRVDFSNTSEGIQKEEIDKIWDSFYKIDKSRTREVGGHGLGLSIVKAIQEAHGNGYGVINKEGKVCFWFEIKQSTEENAVSLVPT